MIVHEVSLAMSETAGGAIYAANCRPRLLPAFSPASSEVPIPAVRASCLVSGSG